MQQLSVIVFRTTEGKILLQFRDSAAPTSPLGWSFFGGMAEDEETPAQAVIREVKEELEKELSPGDFRLIVERVWDDESSGQKINVHLYEGLQPMQWGDFVVHEGAGAAFLTKDEIEQLPGVSLLAKTWVRDYC
ncbi:MAG: NUDIX domain-containing protein [Candidatus Peribacteraceae bacterium]